MTMISVRVGTDDIGKARAFYDATFAVLGGEPAPVPAEYPMAIYRFGSGPAFLVGPPRDGEPATHANGGTILFAAENPEAVSAWHAAGLANGGTSEGEPADKPQAPGAFGAYLRDPDGNKLGAFHGLKMS